jgi:acyl carrier protein
MPNANEAEPSLRDQLKLIVLRALRREDIPQEKLEGTELIEELGITSIDALEILIGVEIAFDIHIKDEDLSPDLISSLDVLEAFVRRSRHESGQAT